MTVRHSPILAMLVAKSLQEFDRIQTARTRAGPTIDFSTCRTFVPTVKTVERYLAPARSTQRHVSRHPSSTPTLNSLKIPAGWTEAREPAIGNILFSHTIQQKADA